MMTAKKWTPEEDELLLKWRINGPYYKTFDEISKALGRPDGLVHRHYEALLRRKSELAEPDKKVYQFLCKWCLKKFKTTDINSRYCCQKHRQQNHEANDYLTGNGSRGTMKATGIAA